MANNITEVRLLNVPLENDYLHTIYFTSKDAQLNYFLGKSTKNRTYTECSYQRKDSYIRIPDQYDNLLGCNYVMYKNVDKWFYAFITDMKYISDGMTEVYIETDVMQTWLKDYTVKPSFVEREHADSDNIGENTVPEKLETGDYIINGKNKNASLLVNSLIMATTIDMNAEDLKDAEPVSGGYYNGVYSGIKYYRVTGAEANRGIKALAEAGRSDALNSIFVCPSLFTSSTYPEGNPNGYAEVTHDMNVVRKDWVNTFGVSDEENYKPINLDGYVPKNNKLYTYPYCYMLMTNNSGGSAVYKYELFNNPDNDRHCAFYIYGSITPGFSIYISPRYYNGVDVNSLEGLALGKFPICAWSTDVYINWLTQNGMNIGIGALTSVGSIAAGIGMLATGGGALAGAGMIATGLVGVASSVGEVYQHSLQPPQAEGNINSGDVMFSSGCLTFTAYQMTIKKEFAKIIDEFFTMYGYKTNRVKVPAIAHRENFWYTKTIDVNIDGAIPTKDLQKIKECYNKGITFWDNPANIGNYSVSNNITG